MQQYTNELTDEIIKSSSQPPFTPEEIATFDESTQQEVLNLTTRFATCPVKLIFRIATVGSLTRNGGVLRKASGKSTVDLTLYIQTHFLSYGCDNFLRINSRGERYSSALCG